MKRVSASAMSDKRISRRIGSSSSLLSMVLIVVAASWMIQETSASMMAQPRLLNIFKGSSPSPSTQMPDAQEEAKYISEALTLAGSHSPTASSISATGTGASKVALVASASASASSSTITAAPSLSSSDNKQGDETWSWAGGAYGCQSGSASGISGLCYATGQEEDSAATSTALVERGAQVTPVIQAARLESQDNEFDDSLFENVRRQTYDDPDNNQSGNAGPPTDINNVDSPDVGWLDTVVGAVPYRNGDLAASIVWIIVTLMLVPLFLIRLLRRSSLIAHVLFTIFLWGCGVIAAFGIRAYLSNTTPTTTLMITENIILQVLPCLLLEPLLNLLAMYSAQGGLQSGVPSVCLLLRIINVIALVLFAIAGAYTGIYMRQWDTALISSLDVGPRDDFPNYNPPNVTRLGPIIGAFMMVFSICGGILMIPIARGENGSMRPGGFLGILFLLVGISVVYRALQSIRAQSTLNNEADGNNNPFAADILLNNGAGVNSFTVASRALLDLADNTIVQISAIAPPGMYSPQEAGLAWNQLQRTMSSRGQPQTPVIFNVVYIFPMWLEVFLLFFVHAPGGDHSSKLQPAAIQPSV